jgi:hypothetical protein
MEMNNTKRKSDPYIPETLLCGRIFPYVIEDRDDWEMLCLISKEINHSMRAYTLPPWPNKNKIQGCKNHGRSFTISEKYLFAAPDKVYDRFGFKCALPSVVSDMQTHHEMVRIGQNHFLAISFYDKPEMVQIWDMDNTDQGPAATLTIPGKAGVK